MEYTVLLMVLYLISNAVTVKTKRPSVLNLHSFMTDEEMAHYLETKSRDDIPEYDVIKLSRHRTKRSTHQDEDKRIYKISAFGKDLKLDVRRTTSTISPSGIVVHRRTLDGRLEKEVFKPEGKFFHGHVVSNPGSRVALREIGDKGELSGAIFSGDHVYKLEPINANLKQKVDIYEEGHHVVSRRSISQRSSGLMEPILAQRISKDNLHQSKRNVMPSFKPKIVELMITVDNSSYEFHGNGTMDFVINVANMLNRLYRDVSMGFDISIALTKVFIIQGFEPGLDYQINQVTNAVKYLGTFSTWGAKQGSKFPTAAPGHFDNGALLTRRVCGLNSCRLDGVAYSGYPCNPNLGFSVNDDTGLQVAFTIAHEMGHNLGMGHDNKTCFKGYIMSAGQQFGPNAFKWSHCSAQELRKALSRVKCYDDQPATATPIASKYPPGYIFDMDKQCKKAFGPSVSQCPVTKENCGLLFCLKGSSCRSHTTPPLDGTPCGKRKWCMRGNCVDVGNDLPPAVDGQWSDWKPYGACSRSCGGGIRYKMRYCNNPSPQFFGKHCVGLDRGGEQICNPQECPTPSDPRTEQCKKQGSSASYYHSGSPCTLYCVYGRVARGHGPVADGTRCYQDADKKDVCVRGKCRRAGCDNVLDSENPYDRCQKCAGNGNECKRLILPDYIKDYRVYGPGKPDVMFTIPVGATSVMIKELQKTYNVLGLKVDPHQQPYVFPVPSYTGTYKAAGTVIQHYMTSFSSEEWIYIRGPTTIKLYAMFVYAGFQINQGVSCQYYIPGKANSTQYVWKVVRGAKCSADCAGGKLYHTITCHRQDDGTAVGTRFCDQNTKPPSREACNTQACTPTWKTEDWNMCSKSCGGGQQTRSVKCEQKVTQITYKTLPASSCSAPQPTAVRSCHNHECPPYWEKGSWSKCSAECGGGTKSRTVTCEQTLLNSSTIALDDQRCLTDVGRKPAEREDCNTMDCYVWDAKYSCKVCTATKGYYLLGCYGDSRSRALPKLLAANLQGDKLNSCYKMAKSQGYNIFGVQNNGECWTSTTGMDTYNKHGPSNKCQNNLGGPWANDVYNIVREKDFTPIGCFNDRHNRKRPLPSFVANLRDKIDWKDMSKTVKECAEDAWQDGFPVFGVQYYGECWSGPLGHKSYDIDGSSLQGCWEGVGKRRANYVYAFSRRVVRPTVTCRHVVSNVKVPDNRCTSIKPEYEMQLCSHVCGNRQ